ncbi:G patch domain containing 3 [Chamberlinius hualienensis]
MSGMIYAIISNIPESYHSADLRNFFSEMVERVKFKCFHYRHRPELRNVSNEADVTAPVQKPKTFCCVIKLKQDLLTELINKYSGRHWIDGNGDTLNTKCYISKVKVKGEVEQQLDHSETQPSNEPVELSELDLLLLKELKPPRLMPNGNVGTPTKYFLQLIRRCKMPPRLITKLGLNFGVKNFKGRYGRVPYNYGLTTVPANRLPCESDFQAYSASGKLLTDYHMPPPPPVMEAEDAEKEDSSSGEDNDTCEEWERHISLHEDVTEQERTKERLYEEEIELKWEKGGSGLVFYTDAQHWDSLKGDFDERTTDDWDVDTSVYYIKNGGDRDSKELAQMRLEKRRRKRGPESVFDKKIGSFEKHTKGIGRKLMEKHGWIEGEGLGKSTKGITEALGNEGKRPYDKSGFGYRGEKLCRNPVPAPRKHFISTIYDKPSTVEIIDPD